MDLWRSNIFNFFSVCLSVYVFFSRPTIHCLFLNLKTKIIIVSKSFDKVLASVNNWKIQCQVKSWIAKQHLEVRISERHWQCSGQLCRGWTWQCRTRPCRQTWTRPRRSTEVHPTSRGWGRSPAIESQPMTSWSGGCPRRAEPKWPGSRSGAWPWRHFRIRRRRSFSGTPVSGFCVRVDPLRRPYSLRNRFPGPLPINKD